MFSPNGTSQELLACTAGTEILSEHPLAQAIVASRAKDLNHKAEAFKASWEKEPLQDVWFVRNGFVGKLEFIRENHEVSRRRIVEQLAPKVNVVVSFGM
jgi:Cd2+/Zn2+-exporting ATPase